MLVTFILITIPNTSYKLMPNYSPVTEVFSNCNTPWFGELMLSVISVSKFIAYYMLDTTMDYAGCFTVSLKGYYSVVNELF